VRHFATGFRAAETPQRANPMRHRDNRSAFFFRLPLRAKPVMEEILVSDHRECRPPLLIGGRFHFSRAERRTKI
jgi:hypothetical protein